jgi:hypothetical protein
MKLVYNSFNNDNIALFLYLPADEWHMTTVISTLCSIYTDPKWNCNFREVWNKHHSLNFVDNSKTSPKWCAHENMLSSWLQTGSKLSSIMFILLSITYEIISNFNLSIILIPFFKLWLFCKVFHSILHKYLASNIGTTSCVTTSVLWSTKCMQMEWSKWCLMVRGDNINRKWQILNCQNLIFK